MNIYDWRQWKRVSASYTDKKRTACTLNTHTHITHTRACVRARVMCVCVCVSIICNIYIKIVTIRGIGGAVSSL